MLKIAALTILLFAVGSCIEYKMWLQTDEVFCFNEFIGESTPFHLRVKSNITSWSLKLMLPNGTVLAHRNDTTATTKKLDSYSAMEELYNFCIENRDSPAVFDVKFYQGLELADVNGLAKADDTAILKAVVDQVLEKHLSVKNFTHRQRQLSSHMMEVQNIASFKTLGLGFLSLAVILIVSFVHYTIIKKMMKNRKMI